MALRLSFPLVLLGWLLMRFINGTPFIDDFSKYIDLSISRKRSNNAHFQFIVQKIESNLSGQKEKLINLNGQVTLAKPILNTIPVYFMQLLLKGICDCIDQIVRSFI